MAKKKPTIKKGLRPQTSKIPRIDPTIQSPLDQKPVWHIGLIDLNGPFGWNNISKNLLLGGLLPKIKNFESMYWKDILGSKSHEVNVSQISNHAQRRLSQLNLDDAEKLVSLRLTGTQRVWGIRMENILQILWWDPNHQVYPSTKKHT